MGLLSLEKDFKGADLKERETEGIDLEIQSFSSQNTVFALFTLRISVRDTIQNRVVPYFSLNSLPPLEGFWHNKKEGDKSNHQKSELKNCKWVESVLKETI